MLETFRPKVIMEMSADNLNRSNHTAQEVIDFWSGLDYHMYQIADNGDVLEINNSDLLATPEDIDLYCVPREKSI